MPEISEQRTTATEAPGLPADAELAGRWAGEPFLRPDEEPSEVLAPGTARRQALDEALTEIGAGQNAPRTSGAFASRSCSAWSACSRASRRCWSPAPSCAATRWTRWPACSRRSITANQRELEEANGFEALPEGEDERTATSRHTPTRTAGRGPDEEPEPIGEDPGAVRRYRFRHPTASGKTIAAAGFVEAARTAGVLILTHRRLLSASSSAS